MVLDEVVRHFCDKTFATEFPRHHPNFGSCHCPFCRPLSPMSGHSVTIIGGHLFYACRSQLHTNDPMMTENGGGMGRNWTLLFFLLLQTTRVTAQNMWELMQRQEELSDIVAFIDTEFPTYRDILKESSNEITLLAPTNTAWAQYKYRDQRLADQTKLTSWRVHVENTIRGLFSNQLISSDGLKRLGLWISLDVGGKASRGVDITVQTTTAGTQITVGGALLVSTDLQAVNGILHITNAVVATRSDLTSLNFALPIDDTLRSYYDVTGASIFLQNSSTPAGLTQLFCNVNGQGATDDGLVTTVPSTTRMANFTNNSTGAVLPDPGPSAVLPDPVDTTGVGLPDAGPSAVLPDPVVDNSTNTSVPALFDNSTGATLPDPAPSAVLPDPAAVPLTPVQLLQQWANNSDYDTLRDSFVHYNTLLQNFYPSQLKEGLVATTTPWSKCGRVWVTKKQGQLCFNDACVVQEFSAQNGVGYLIDKCLLCPNVREMVRLTAAVSPTDSNVTYQVMHELPRSAWLDGDENLDVTVLSPVRAAWASLSETIEMWLTDTGWNPHRTALLRQTVVPGKYEGLDLLRLWKQNGNQPFGLTTLAGTDLTIDYVTIDNGRQLLTINEGLFLVINLAASDGTVHMTNHTPSAPFLSKTVYGVGLEQSDLSSHMDLMTSVRTEVEEKSPITALFMPNAQWVRYTILEEESFTESVIRSMVFEGVFSCDKLLKMDGRSINSISGAAWAISSSANGKFPCLMDMGGTQKACITQCDLVAKNGLGHYVDNLLSTDSSILDVIPGSLVATSAPTPAPLSDEEASEIPTIRVQDFDMDKCLSVLPNRSIRIVDYYRFIEDYLALTCRPPPNDEVLTSTQIAYFEELACRCAGAPACCQGTSAFIHPGYRKEVCRDTHRDLFGTEEVETLCTASPTPPPISRPTSNENDNSDDADTNDDMPHEADPGTTGDDTDSASGETDDGTDTGSIAAPASSMATLRWSWRYATLLLVAVIARL